jgi:hypothetical protein
MHLEELKSDICLSGGADGADLQWGMCSGAAGMSVIHWTFRGHRSQAPASEVVELNDAQLAEANPYCERANLTLGRSFPPKSNFAANLLRRNWFQVRDAQACYAVSTIKDGVVQGGTSWATQMFIDGYEGAPCPCYVFCQEDGRWHVWDGSWQPIFSPPKPSGVFAGIGTRALGITGKLAIRVLLDYKAPT